MKLKITKNIQVLYQVGYWVHIVDVDPVTGTGDGWFEFRFHPEILN